MIPYSRQSITEEDIDAVVQVLRSDFLTQGPVVGQFEQAVAAQCEVDYAVAVASGTAALHVACLALGVTAGDLVLVAATSFVASANCAKYCGADVDFVDIDIDSGLLSSSCLEQCLARHKALGRVPKALIVVHMAGQSCDMRAISAQCQDQGIALLEDASHALGGTYTERPIGSCQYSDISVLSFHPIKPVAAGEGGMLLSNNAELAGRARLFANHGITRDPELLQNKDVGKNGAGWYYEQQQLGYNYRLSDIHAALGLSQLKKLQQGVAARTLIADRYSELFAQSEIKPLLRNRNCESAWHLFIVQFSTSAIRDKVFDRLRNAGFGVNLHYLPIPGHPYYQQQGFLLDDFPAAKEFAQRSLSLPIFASMPMTVAEQVAELCLSEYVNAEGK